MVTEDDPQNGFDHVDGHRTVGLVVSPYTRRKVVDSTCYNQTGLVKTVELILGLPPMTQLDLSATPLAGCFTGRAVEKLDGRAKAFALKSLERDFDAEDRADEDALDRILWFSVRGDRPYPGDE